MLGTKIVALREVLSNATLNKDSDFNDVVDVLSKQPDVTASCEVDARGVGATHSLRVHMGDAVICIEVFTNDKYFAVRKGYILHGNATYWYRWNHALDGFEFDGPADMREPLYRLLVEVLKGF